MAQNPTNLSATRALYWLLNTEGRLDEAGEVLEAAVALRPDSISLQSLHAVHFEKTGDVDRAIAIYEALYERYPNSVPLANNLA
ncbi:MAG: tetratricopeptide repeat protein, partial [Burkholderiales bacterium]|nr:tetratricopeptide repeat protein [Burkholderiales bacterium]